MVLRSNPHHRGLWRLLPRLHGGRIIGYAFVLSSLGILGVLIGRISSFLNTLSEERKLGYRGTSFSNHVVIIGWDRFAQTVLEQMLEAKVKTAVVTSSRTQLELLHESYDRRLVFPLLSDYHNFELMEHANLKEASTIFVNIPDDAEKLVFLINAKKRYGDEIPFAVILEDAELTSTFRSTGASFVLSKNDIASKMIASFIFEPAAASYMEDLMASAVTDEDFDIQQYRVLPKNPYAGQLYNDAFFDLKASHDALLIGIVKISGGQRTLMKNPDDPTLTVDTGDYLILIVSGKVGDALEELFGIGEGSIR